MSQISIIPGISSPIPAPKVFQAGGKADPGVFIESLKAAMEEVNNNHKEANASIADLQSGKVALHETMIQVEKAEISFRMLMSVRNKMLEAYKEIMRINV